MIEPKSGNFCVYKSKLNYNYSILDLYMKKNKNNYFQIILQYEQIIEYNLNYNFSDIKKINPIFESIYDFFKYLNECSDEFYFNIKDDNKEYCDLTLNFDKEDLNEINFRLISKYKIIDIDTYKEQKLLNMKVDELIDMCKNSENRTILKDIPYQNIMGCYLFKLKKHNFIIFESDAKLEIYNYKDKSKIIEEYVRTNYDIKNIISKNKLDENSIYYREHIFKEFINYIDIFINNNIIKLIVIQKEIPKAKFGQDILNISENHTREEYSKYFYEYFENYNPKNNHKIFKYINNEKRNEIFNNILKLRNTDEINQYNITGPSSSGKSMTLFAFSRTNKNVIYINMKVLLKYQNNYSKFLEIIFSECSRLQIDEKIFNEKIQSLKIQNNIIYQLIDIINIILDLTKENIILIIDQYKKYKYILEMFTEFFLVDKINEMIKEKNNLNIVICSPSDGNIKSGIIKVLNKYKGNPPELNKETQEYYFYYNNLFIPKKTNTFFYKYFHNNYKYAQKALIYRNLTQLYNKIIKKLEKNVKGLKYEMEAINLSNILILFKNGPIKIENINDFLNFIKLIPLEYFSFDFNNGNILIEPIFPFINNCISKYINMDDCTNFYNDDYIYSGYFYDKVKENYFNYSTIESLQNKEIIQMPYDYNIKTEIININDIIVMDKIEPNFTDIESEFSLFLNIMKNTKDIYFIDIDDENDIKEKEKEKLSNTKNILEKNNNYICNENIFVADDNIIIDITEKIDDEILNKKIEEILANYYLKDFKNEFLNEIESVDEAGLNYNFIAEETIEYMKNIKNFKKEAYENKILHRKKEILTLIQKIQDNNNNAKGKIKIPISQYNSNINIPKYTGNENFLLKQENKKGIIFDFAILYGKRNEKKFIGFQLINYPVDDKLYSLLCHRHLYKSFLSRILINSINLFNCHIKEWHYIPIIYYNKDDPDINTIGYHALLFSFKMNYECILYDPANKIFLSKKLTPLTNLSLTKLSSLDSTASLNNSINFSLFPLNFFDEENYEFYKKINNNGMYKFIDDFYVYADRPDEILKILAEKLGVNKLIYYFYFHYNFICYPILNFIYLYKKKESSYFIAVLNREKSKIIDLENDKDLTDEEYEKYIDIQYKYTYLLYFDS